jgi:hypothetical protein
MVQPAVARVVVSDNLSWVGFLFVVSCAVSLNTVFIETDLSTFARRRINTPPLHAS